MPSFDLTCAASGPIRTERLHGGAVAGNPRRPFANGQVPVRASSGDLRSNRAGKRTAGGAGSRQARAGARGTCPGAGPLPGAGAQAKRGSVKRNRAFRANPRYRGDGTRVDLAYAVYALARGVDLASVKAALGSRDLSHKGSRKRQMTTSSARSGKLWPAWSRRGDDE
jgi:hypothetical protein